MLGYASYGVEVSSFPKPQRILSPQPDRTHVTAGGGARWMDEWMDGWMDAASKAKQTHVYVEVEYKILRSS